MKKLEDLFVKVYDNLTYTRLPWCSKAKANEPLYRNTFSHVHSNEKYD